MFYNFARGLMGFIFRILFRIEVSGVQNIPEDDGALICPNHYHWGDPVIVAISIPRKINFMAKYEIFKVPVIGFILRKVDAYPVRRGEADLSASKTTLRLLKDKQLVGIFPEGTRIKGGEHGKMGRANSGVAVFSVKTKKPVVPVLITGNYKPFTKMKVIIGEPVDLYKYKKEKMGSEEYNELSQMIMERIAGLKREEL